MGLYKTKKDMIKMSLRSKEEVPTGKYTLFYE